MKTYNFNPAKSSEALLEHACIKQWAIRNIIILSITVLLFLCHGCSGSDDSTDTSSGSQVAGAATFAPGNPMAMGFNGDPTDSAADQPFTVVILPDTQCYSQNYPATYYAQANWIARNASGRNIKFVIHLGDIVNKSVAAQWEVADAAHDILDNNSIPYCATIGNHDYETISDPKRDSTKFNQYFGTSRFSGRSWYGGGYPAGKNDNSYHFFESDGLQFLVVSLEFAPRKDTLAWAADIVNSYQDYRVIIVTHGYLWTSSYSPRHANVTTYDDIIGSDGTTLFNEFISRYSNIFMVIAGHAGGDSVRSIMANDGHTIYEVLVDYQYESNGGNGWFKTMQFSPSEGAITITPYTVSSDVTTFDNTTLYSSDRAGHIYKVSYDMGTMSAFAEDINPVGFNDRTINFTGSGNQKHPKVAGTSSGYSIAVWEDDADNNGNYNIKMRGFTPDGTENFGEITVNSNTIGAHLNPSVAINSSGNAVVVWQDDSDGDGYFDIRMSGYTIDGTCRFADYTVNSESDGQHVKPVVGMDSTGKFVVVWQDNTGGSNEIQMKGFDENGLEYFSQRAANGTSAGDQLNPDVEVLSNGNFAVVWEDDNDGNGSYRIYMRGFEFSSSATEYFSEREVNPTGCGEQLDPAICKLAGGSFAVAWEDDNDSDGYYEIYTGGFDSTGSQYFIQKAAGVESNGRGYDPAIASDDDGNFAVAWQDGQDDEYDIMARAFNQSAAQIMAQVRVNKDESGRQTAPDLTVGSDGRIVVVWSDDTDSDGYAEILGRGAYDFGFELYYGD